MARLLLVGTCSCGGEAPPQSKDVEKCSGDMRILVYTSPRQLCEELYQSTRAREHDGKRQTPSDGLRIWRCENPVRNLQHRVVSSGNAPLRPWNYLHCAEHARVINSQTEPSSWVQYLTIISEVGRIEPGIQTCPYSPDPPFNRYDSAMRSSQLVMTTCRMNGDGMG